MKPVKPVIAVLVHLRSLTCRQFLNPWEFNVDSSSGVVTILRPSESKVVVFSYSSPLAELVYFLKSIRSTVESAGVQQRLF